jgi:hypothetical protein
MIAMTFVMIETPTMIEALMIAIRTPTEKNKINPFALAKVPMC